MAATPSHPGALHCSLRRAPNMDRGLQTLGATMHVFTFNPVSTIGAWVTDWITQAGYASQSQCH